MLRPVTSFEMKQKIPPFPKNKKIPISFDFQDIRIRIWVNFRSNRKVCRGETPNFHKKSGKLHLLTCSKKLPGKNKRPSFQGWQPSFSAYCIQQ
jgi:hypothetical protein